MPAILPLTLKKQIENLFVNFQSPNLFIRSLKNIFFYYSDRTRKLKNSTAQFSLVRSYHVPKQVSRRIEMALQAKTIADPEAGIILADNLWKESWLECRKLAFLILGWISPNPTFDVSGRLREWCEICGNDRVMDTAFAVGLAELWRKSPELMISELESWMTSSNPTKKIWGMRVVQELSNDILLNYLPTIFQLLTPYIQSMVIPPDTDLILAVKNLAEQHPQETAFFLRRIITTSDNDGVYALIRQSLDSFSSPTRQELKNFLYQKREELGDH